MQKPAAPRVHQGPGQRQPPPNKYKASEMPPPDSPIDSEGSDEEARAKLVTFYRNGDPFYSGLSIPINPKYCATFGSLLTWLNDKIPTSSGVRHIFNLNSGAKISGVEELRPGECYIVSSVNRLIPDVDYGGGKARGRWSVKRVSAGRIRRGELNLFANNRTKVENNGDTATSGSSHSPVNPASPSTNSFPPTRIKQGKKMSKRPRPLVNGDKLGRPLRQTPAQRPVESTSPPVSQPYQPMAGPRFAPTNRRNPGRTMNIISNTHRYSREKVLLNRYTSQSFEEMLRDFTDILLMDNPPVQTLYTAETPFERVWSFSQLHNEFKYHDTFIACGRELRPMELNALDPNPMKLGLSLGAPDVSPFPTNRSNGHISNNFNRPYWWNKEEERFDRYPMMRSRSIERFESPHTPFPDYPGSSRPVEQPLQIRVRGAVRSVWPPSFNADVTSEIRSPSKGLQEDWIYGMNSEVLARSLVKLKTGEILYPVGKIVVVLNSRDERQRYYVDHSAHVTCCCVHPTEAQAASGQGSDGKHPPCVKVWDVRQLRTLTTVFDTHFQDTIWSIQFSIESRGKYLVVLDGDSNRQRQSIYIFSWRERTVLARTKTSKDQVIGVQFHADDDTTVLTYGRQHINFWRIFWAGQAGDHVRILRDKKSGQFLDSAPAYVLCVAFDLVGNVVTGDSDGCIRVWTLDDDDAFVCRPVQHLQNAHRDPITALSILGDGTLLTGSHSSMTAWDTLNDFMFVREARLDRHWGQVVRICPMSPRSLDGHLIIACSGSVIAEGSVQDGFRLVTRGHTGKWIYTATHPREHSFVSAGDDCRLIKWSLLQHHCPWATFLEQACTALAYHPEGHLIVVGTDVGRFIVFDNQNGAHVMSFQLGVESINTIKYSPDVHLITFGCRDGTVHLFAVDRDGLILRRREGPLKAHLSSVCAIDWDQQSSKVRTQGSDGSVKAWDVQRMRQIEDHDVRDVKFDSSDCFINYYVKGIWQRTADKKSICIVANRAFCEDHYCVGTSGGKVQLYSYPILNEKDRCVQQDLHDGPIKSVKFSFDDNYLLSSDECTSPCIIQWSLIVKRM